MIKSMAPAEGRMAVVLPHGALFRMGKEGAIRKKILHMDVLEAVIGLGPNLFSGTGLAACILVFRQRKAKDRKKKVLILDASREFKTGRAQNELLPEHVERIHGWYRDYKDVEGVAKVVTLDDIAANDHNLNIPRYVDWQHTSQGERLVQKELRRTLLKYKLHTDQELFDKAYGYIKQYY
jgi:type I restriction enzyme M protein